MTTLTNVFNDIDKQKVLIFKLEIIEHIQGDFFNWPSPEFEVLAGK